MEITIININEVNDRRRRDEDDIWITLELNRQDVEDMEEGKTLGFETSTGKRFLIIPIS